MEQHQEELGEGRGVFPSIHFLARQAARERQAARWALTEAARERHLALADQYLKRAAEMQASLHA
jgi:hypothetical protein